MEGGFKTMSKPMTPLNLRPGHRTKEEDFTFEVDELLYAMALGSCEDDFCEVIDKEGKQLGWACLFRWPLLGEDSIGSNFGLNEAEIAFLNAQAGAIVEGRAGQRLIKV